MQSGRISPIFRQFFSTALTSKGATDSNSQNQNQHQQDREPSDEEAKAAFEFLLSQEELKAQGLQVELQTVDGRHSIVVSDRSGTPLRTIKGMGIVRVLETRALGKTGHQLGRILDRRL